MLRRVFAKIIPGLVAAFLVWPTGMPASAEAPNLRKKAPDFTLSDSKGAPIRLSDFKGKVVVLDFWATWCEGCKVEIPWYMEFQNQYKGRELSVIGVSMDDDGWKSVRPFIQDHNMNYPVVIGTQNLAKQYGVEAMPVTLLIDREGRIAHLHNGLVEKDAFEREIRALLQEVPKNT